MNDFDWYNYLKANFKPDQGSAYFFDLANCHVLEDLNPILLSNSSDLEDHIHKAVTGEFKLAYFDHFESEISFYFTKEEFEKEENLTTAEVYHFKVKRKLDMEKVKQELAKLISFLNSESS